MLSRFARDARSGRQLQHRRPLALAQTGDQHDLPVGELQGVVMHVRAVHVDLPEPGHLVSNFAEPHARQQAVSMVALLERNVLDIHFRANDGAQNLEIYARCFQWEQKSCVPQFECVEESHA